jgi:hypothetical protein
LPDLFRCCRVDVAAAVEKGCRRPQVIRENDESWARAGRLVYGMLAACKANY